MVTVQNEYDSKKGTFYIEDNGQRIAEMVYVFSGEDMFIIEHTEVDPSQEGKGLGKLLVKEAVEWAREKDYKILPLCPYAKRIFDKTPEYADVLFKMGAN